MPIPHSDTEDLDQSREADTSPRRRWMSALARAEKSDLEPYWQTHGNGIEYQLLRKPECGLVMVRGRAGGSGQRFNLGEMSVTRCSVRMPDGTVGHAYVAGRDQRHAELAAAFDALLQASEYHETIEREVIAPLEAKSRAQRESRSKKAAATKVEFYTMARGENE